MLGIFIYFTLRPGPILFLLLFEFVFRVKIQLFLTKHEYLSLNRAVVQTQRWAQSGPITSGAGPGFVFEESILRSLSCIRQEEKKAGCLSAQSGSQSACSYLGVGRRICVAGPLGDLSKGRQVFFPEPSSETWLGDTQATQES